MKRVNIQAAFIGTMAIALSASMLLGSYTNDREYYMGEDDINSPGIGDFVDTSGSGTYDSEYDGNDDNQYFDAQDIRRITGAPTYQAGHGAGSTLSIRFGGADAMAAVIDGPEGDISWAFNRPDWYWDQGAFGSPTDYPRNYETIRGRGVQLWIKPTNLNGTRQDVLLDSSEFGGVVITENNKWGLANDMDHSNLAFDNDGIIEGIGAAADVQEGQWAHAMVVTNNGGGSPVMYINGIAVAALPGYFFDTTPLNDPNDSGSGLADAPQPLFIGASDLWGEGYANFFEGDVDDIEMFLWGDNSDQDDGKGHVGQDWGTLNLTEDNEYIAQQIAASAGLGDLNFDGVHDQADVDIFAANWMADDVAVQLIGMTTGDITTYQKGDLDIDGDVDRDDWFLLRQGFIAGGAALPGGADVPEPATMMLLGLGGLAMLRKRQK